MTPNPQDQQRDEENPDDRPQPPQRMNSEERSNEEALRTQARNTMRSLLGSGYVDSYYDGAASDFVGLAQWWASVQVAAVERERDAYKRAKAENDDRFMLERDEARSALAAALARIAAVEAETAERCRLAVAALYTEGSYPPPRGTHRDADPLGAYDSGVADAEIALADIRDAARAVLAASPTPTGTEPLRVYRERPRGAAATPTGPEAAKYDYCPHGWTRAHCGSCHDEVYGPATPEPTEETP